jgi:beta-galactosidase/beta-glucuronidase
MKLSSIWGEKLNENAPLPEYPRMGMQRDSYYNLNGAWEYQITDRRREPDSDKWKKIIVPFAVGSLLSQAEQEPVEGKALWYRKQFAYHPNTMHTWLNFEAVDMECTVFVNGMEAGTHKGGYEPFSFDISGMVKYQNALMVKCIDDSEKGLYAFGKQKTEHGGMWYTPSSGIWGTVWMEDVGEHGIQDLKITPDYDHSKVIIDLAGDFSQALVTIASGGHVLHSGITNDRHYEASIDNMHAWSPDDPFLYDLYVNTEDDTVRSYFGMRKISKGIDSNGYARIYLNDKPLFLSGLLDQGYSVDGLMTYPSDEAIRDEIAQIKGMGFNMLRKHVKIENRRWYYACDQLGMLVMQDMPSGGYDHYDQFLMAVLPTVGFRHLKDTGNPKFGRISEGSKRRYYSELDEMLSELYNNPCIMAWVPFNEGWGQFNAAEVTNHIRTYDRTRLIDSASGWFDQGCGDFDSIHNYFTPYHTHKDHEKRISLLSEFGGYSYAENGHSNPKKVYGYKVFKDRLALNQAVQELYEKKVLSNIDRGLAGCIYTQVSDIEDEVNGLFTADRKVLKIDAKKMKKINEKCIRRVK